MLPLVIGIAMMAVALAGLVFVHRREEGHRAQAARAERRPGARLAAYFGYGTVWVACLLLLGLGAATTLFAWSAL